MGLDMYLFKEVKGKKEDEPNEQIGYWRKHPDLHGKIEKMYQEESGDYEPFDCKKFYLDEEKINDIIDDVKENRLPFTEGFFFGSSSDYWNTDEGKKETLEILEKALELVKAGETVYYDSWW